MSTETALLVRLPGDTPGLLQLLRDIRAADKRARLSVPGERTDIVRVEALASQLERLAGLELARRHTSAIDTPVVRLTGLGFIDRDNLHEQSSERRAAITPWLTGGDVAVELRRPFGAGRTRRKTRLGPIIVPESAWEGAPPGTPRYEAVALRFKQQMEATLTVQEPPAHIEPSGVSNTVLTETLRTFVGMQGDRIEVPVRYQDGSIAKPFPLRSLRLQNEVIPYPRELRLALLSIRHTEMDIEVDGCWLRNFDISRPRPAAETDLLAFELSVSQLANLTRRGPLKIYLYQTGLDPAVMGFYRAIVYQLMRAPGSIAVIPKYYRHPPKHPDKDGSPVVQSAFFAEGKPWAT